MPPTEFVDTGLVDDPIVVDDTFRCQEKNESTAQVGVASATHPGRSLGRSPGNIPGNIRSDETKKFSSVDPGMALPGHSNHQAEKNNEMGANYGVNSLFDGVSSVVTTLRKKIGYAPRVIILAEMDTTLRALVCAEHGYRTDQKWGYASYGSAGMYVNDVNSLLDNSCKILEEANLLSPDSRWIIVGGSPCQDPTFAGAHHGIVGLVGKSSGLFFTVLGVIRATQEITGVG